MAVDYHKDVEQKNILKLRDRMKELPQFLSAYFLGRADVISSRTKLVYALDFKIFFNFLVDNMFEFCDKKVTEFTLDDLGKVTPEHIEEFAEYLSYYTKDVDGKTIIFENEQRGKNRKLAAIRSMFSYYFKRRKIPANVAELVDFPKLKDKSIVRLEVDEVAKLLDEVEKGSNMTHVQKIRHDQNMLRDLAIVTLLLGTGIRVSECVGINIEHLDFENNALKITRKGGDESILYFGEEVQKALKDYLDYRKALNIKEGHEQALFISRNKTRLCDRQIETLVKRYASNAIMLKKITPHKLRSTFGTALYRETGDIFLVADILGHSDVNTTTKHYAAMDEDKRRSAANIVKLRDE